MRFVAVVAALSVLCACAISISTGRGATATASIGVDDTSASVGPAASGAYLKGKQ